MKFNIFSIAQAKYLQFHLILFVRDALLIL